MLEFKYIKGPWTCNHYPDRSLIHKYNDHESHEDCKGDLLLAKVAGIGEIREATATLMAAAPELLNACESALSFIDDYGDPEAYQDGEIRKALKRAIAKAKGEV
jgi:hypothetical protein